MRDSWQSGGEWALSRAESLFLISATCKKKGIHFRRSHQRARAAECLKCLYGGGRTSSHHLQWCSQRSHGGGLRPRTSAQHSHCPQQPAVYQQQQAIYQQHQAIYQAGTVCCVAASASSQSATTSLSAATSHGHRRQRELCQHRS